jgi:hypothetical protein
MGKILPFIPFILLSYVVYSQIWLNPLLDDYLFGNITNKLKAEETKKKKKTPPNCEVVHM